MTSWQHRGRLAEWRGDNCPPNSENGPEILGVPQGSSPPHSDTRGGVILLAGFYKKKSLERVFLGHLGGGTNLLWRGDKLGGTEGGDSLVAARGDNCISEKEKNVDQGPGIVFCFFQLFDCRR